MRGQFGRVVLVLSLVATLALIWVGYEGYRLEDSREAVAKHLATSMTVVLALVFGHSWVLLYLTSLGRGLSTLGAAGGEPWTWRRQRATVSVLGTAVVLLLVVFLLGPAVMLRMLPPWTHGVAFFTAVLCQIVALVLEARAVAVLEGRLKELRRGLSTA